MKSHSLTLIIPKGRLQDKIGLKHQLISNFEHFFVISLSSVKLCLNIYVTTLLVYEFQPYLDHLTM